MEWLATVAAAVITALATVAAGMLARAIPSELRRARELTEQLKNVDHGSPLAVLVGTLRDDQLIAWSLRNVVVLSSWSQRGALVLIGAGMGIAVLALVPLVLGIVDQVNGHHNEVASLLTLLLSAASAVLLAGAAVLTRKHTALVQAKHREFRAAWGLPAPVRVTRPDAHIPPPPHPAACDGIAV